MRGGREVGIGVVRTEGEAYRGHAYYAAFEHGPHRAGVEYAYSGVVPVVDAREYQVGAEVAETVQGEFYAIDGCAVARIEVDAAARGLRGEPQRHVHRDGARLSRAGGVGGYDPHFAEVGDEIGEVLQPLGGDAVVVGDEYAGAVCCGRCRIFHCVFLFRRQK